MPAAGAAQPAAILHSEKLALAVDLLRGGSPIRLKVRGLSMLPTLWPGDILSIAPTGSEPLKTGEIVFVLHGSQSLIHRVQGRVDTPQGARWLTCGDAISAVDPPACGAQVLGRITRVFRNGRYQSLPARRSFANRVSAWIFRHSDFSLRLVLHFQARFRRSRDESFALPASGSLQAES